MRERSESEGSSDRAPDSWAATGFVLSSNVKTAAAARQASEEPALPVLAVATTAAPVSRARDRTTALARSLNEALGLTVSSFRNRWFSPARRPSRSTRYSGVAPTHRGEAGPGSGSFTGSSAR